MKSAGSADETSASTYLPPYLLATLLLEWNLLPPLVECLSIIAKSDPT